MKKSYDKINMLNIEITDEANNAYFEQVAKNIIKELNAVLVNKLDGLDQSYWDFEVGAAKFCLHQENTLGIFIYAQNEQGNELLEKLDLSKIIK